MRHPLKIQALKILAIMLAFGVLLGVSALAQSGRKQKKAEVQPPPQGVNQPETRTVAEPEIAPEKPKEKEKEKGPAILVSRPARRGPARRLARARRRPGRAGRCT